MLTFVSEAVLFDTILSLGLMICFYYGLTAIGCVWYFRKELFTSFYNVIFKFLFPLLGGIGLWFVFFVTIRDSAEPGILRHRIDIFGVGDRAGARARADPARRGLMLIMRGPRRRPSSAARPSTGAPRR